MDVLGWLVVVLAVGAIVVLTLATARVRRTTLWCPERETLAEVEVDGEVYATGPGDRRIRFCSLWDLSRRSTCNRGCLTRFSPSRPVGGRGEGPGAIRNEAR